MQCVLFCSCCLLCLRHTLFPCTQALNEDGCMLGAKIVWMTLMETRSVRRWAACELGSSRVQFTRSAGRRLHCVCMLDRAAALCQALGHSGHPAASATHPSCTCASLECSLTALLRPFAAPAADNPVTDDTIKDWAGFVSMIADGYFNRRMAWFPIDRLQMELLAVQGLAAPPHDVAEWARIVYTVLEKVHPQFPSE